MAKINRKELVQLTSDQLNEKYIELSKELMKLNMQRASGTPPENPGMIKATKKSIARINTYLMQKKKTQVVEKVANIKKSRNQKESSKKEVKDKK